MPTWAWISDLPLVVQGVLWLLFLPLMAGLWIWQADWPFWLRLVLITGLAWANMYVFFPKRSRRASPGNGL